LPDNLVAYPDCDVPQRIQSLPPGETARSVHCGRSLVTARPGSLERTLPLPVDAAMAFIPANTFPLMALSATGRSASTTRSGSTSQMCFGGRQDATAPVAVFAVIGPALQITLLSVVLFATLAAARSRALARLSADVADAIRTLGGER
jgi:paraquat-inducible protein A